MERIEALRKIREEHQAAKVEGIMIDATTAFMLLTVHDALSVDNRAKFNSLSLAEAIVVGWKLVR